MQYLISVSGIREGNPERDDPKLTSLVFGTNKRNYGPFGKKPKTGKFVLIFNSFYQRTIPNDLTQTFS